eukprot:gene1949-2219_t
MVKQAFYLSSSSKASMTTLQCVSANGSVIPLAVYFSGKWLNPEYCLGFPKNVFIGFSDNGWMESYHFYVSVTNHFVQQIPPKCPIVLPDEWKKACTKLAFENPGVVVTKRTFSRIFIEAFDRAARLDIIKSSFKCAGNWPVNRDQISLSMFPPLKTFQAPINASVDQNGTETEPSVASTPTKPKAHSRDTVYRSMDELEEISGVARV